MAISLSKDGLNFNKVVLIRSGVPKIKYYGRWRAKGFQYPHSLVLRDNLWVIFSVGVGKEYVQVTRIPINEIISL